eukprot:1189336-Prorocentrum_minimum.AAC.3
MARLQEQFNNQTQRGETLTSPTPPLQATTNANVQRKVTAEEDLERAMAATREADMQCAATQREVASLQGSLRELDHREKEQDQQYKELQVRVGHGHY